MRTKHSLRHGLLLGLFLANGALGCEVQDCGNAEKSAEGFCLKSLKRFERASETATVDYAGDDIVIKSSNGNVYVVEGEAGVVSAEFEPFVLRAHDITEEEAEQDFELLDLAIASEGGDVHVDVTREDGAPLSLGADITVAIPPEFAGNLQVEQNNGPTDVRYVAAANGVIVKSENGSCDVVTGAASKISIRCDNGLLSASISDVTGQSGTGFSTGNGSIALSLPARAVFSVQAAALAGGTVSVENMPAECTLAVASESAKTLSCNGATTADPVYQVRADGTSGADVVLSF
jgi:DUF4097 and DUF4098 domain-containing protein YvlB